MTSCSAPPATWSPRSRTNDPASPDQGRCPASTSISAWRARAEADRRAGRVGGDPGAITKGNGKATTPYGAPPPEAVAAEQKRKGILGGLFGR